MGRAAGVSSRPLLCPVVSLLARPVLGTAPVKFTGCQRQQPPESRRAHWGGGSVDRAEGAPFSEKPPRAGMPSGDPAARQGLSVAT